MVSQTSNAELRKNRLTQCFDEIMRTSAEMLVQQQLVSIQVDPSMVNGFTQAQQLSLKEKVNTFHAILDDLEATLGKSKYYVEELARLGKEKVLLQEQERQRKLDEERRRKSLEEEEQKKKRLKLLEEEEKKEADLKEKQESERQQQQQQQQQNEGFDFGVGTPSDLLAGFTNTNFPESVQSTANITPTNNNGAATNPAPSSTLPSRFSNPGSMDMSMFSGMDVDFDMSAFTNMNSNTTGKGNNINNSENNNKNDNDNNSKINKASDNSTDEKENTVQDNVENLNLPDNGGDYLTLNDFNDLNIDWNASGETGELDLSSFNI